MRECAFLHSSAYVLRSPCGEARRASLLTPLGTLRGQTQPFGWLYRFAPFGKNQGQKPLSPLRGENRFFCTEERFADKPNLRPSGWLYPLRSTAWRISIAPLGNLHRMLCLLRCAQKSKPFVL